MIFRSGWEITHFRQTIFNQVNDLTLFCSVSALGPLFVFSCCFYCINNVHQDQEYQGGRGCYFFNNYPSGIKTFLLQLVTFWTARYFSVCPTGWNESSSRSFCSSPDPRQLRPRAAVDSRANFWRVQQRQQFTLRPLDVGSFLCPRSAEWMPRDRSDRLALECRWGSAIYRNHTALFTLIQKHKSCCCFCSWKVSCQ